MHSLMNDSQWYLVINLGGVGSDKNKQTKKLKSDSKIMSLTILCNEFNLRTFPKK